MKKLAIYGFVQDMRLDPCWDLEHYVLYIMLGPLICVNTGAGLKPGEAQKQKCTFHVSMTGM